MNLSQTIRARFHKPTGLLGHLAGGIMLNRPSNRRRNEWVVDLLDVSPKDNVLEIGIGPGYASGILSRRCPTARILGLDHSQTMIQKAGDRKRDAIESGIVSLALDTVETMPAPSSLFDRVMTVNSFHFWNDRIATLRRLRGMMRPGGVIEIAEQPRSKGANDDLALRTAKLIARELRLAGFSSVRTEQLPMKPVTVVCVLGIA